MNWKKIKLVGLYISTVLSVLLLAISLLLMIVDPVGIIFTYISVLFFIPSVFSKKTKMVYIALFLIANFVFLLYVYEDSKSNNIVSHDYSSNPFKK